MRVTNSMFRYVEKAGVYKLEVENLHYHFEPVVVEIPTEQ